jgi:hypothetical protein
MVVGDGSVAGGPVVSVMPTLVAGATDNVVVSAAVLSSAEPHAATVRVIAAIAATAPTGVRLMFTMGSLVASPAQLAGCGHHATSWLQRGNSGSVVADLQPASGLMAPKL